MDHALAAAFALAWPLWVLRREGAYRETVRAGVPGARLAAYAGAMVTQWLFASAAVGLWIHRGRDWGEIGLRGLAGGRAWTGLLVAAVLGGFFLAQSAVVARRPALHDEVRAALLRYRELLPAHRSDLTGFLALSITAGVCEELLFRGLLPWYLGHGLPPWAAQAAALALFAAAHLYLGWMAVVRAFLAGGAAAGLYLWTGSLLPGMLLHAAVDAAGGWMAYAVAEAREAPVAPAG